MMFENNIEFLLTHIVFGIPTILFWGLIFYLYKKDKKRGIK